MDQKTREKLSKPVQSFKKPGAGGRSFSYIKGEDVIGRLNTAFKHDWSSRVVKSWVTEDKIKQVVVLVEITANGISHQGYGGAEVAVYSSGNRQGEPVDVSNSWKSALTNALKNSAKHFGIGLLTDETDTDFTESVEAPTPPPVAKPVIAVPAAPALPVVGSSAKAATSEEKKNEQVSKILEKAGVKSAPSPSIATLAENFKGDTTPPTPAASPFKPSTGQTDAVNDVQIGAMVAMSKLKGIDPAKAIEEATGSGSKKEFKELNGAEARKVIKHLHVAPKGA